MIAASSPANNLYQLVGLITATEDLSGWVTATVVNKHRSSYRKPGAMMLVSPLGQTFGLISGGCLESDIVLRARRVLEYGVAEYVVYDSAEDGNIAAELGLGCNGRIGVIVEPLTTGHHSLYQALYRHLQRGCSATLIHCLEPVESCGLRALVDKDDAVLGELPGIPQVPALAELSAACPVETAGAAWSLVKVKPPVRLLIAGGGVDARPVAHLAATLGWRVTVADHRTVNARKADFPAAESLLRSLPGRPETALKVDAAIVMSHNLDTDARWIRYLSDMRDLYYVGLLGPESRKAEVMALAGLASQGIFARRVRGPMGIDIGGDLPEAVAVSVIAQCHRELADKGLI